MVLMWIVDSFYCWVVFLDIPLFIHLFMGNWVVSSLVLLEVKLLWTQAYNTLYKYVFHFSCANTSKYVNVSVLKKLPNCDLNCFLDPFIFSCIHLIIINIMNSIIHFLVDYISNLGEKKGYFFPLKLLSTILCIPLIPAFSIHSFIILFI